MLDSIWNYVDSKLWSPTLQNRSEIRKKYNKYENLKRAKEQKSIRHKFDKNNPYSFKVWWRKLLVYKAITIWRFCLEKTIVLQHEVANIQRLEI